MSLQEVGINGISCGISHYSAEEGLICAEEDARVGGRALFINLPSKAGKIPSNYQNSPDTC
jgi:hypothetical protein